MGRPAVGDGRWRSCMNAVATLALLGWAPAMLLVCTVTPIRVALLIAAIGGWLFLPEASFDLPGLPNYTKTFAISVAMLAGASMFGGGQLWSVRWTLWDLPMFVLLVSPCFSAVANETGAYDAWTAVFARWTDVFVPYWVGRAYFTTPATARLLLIGIFVGGLSYVLPCMYEVRFSPQLHLKIYGFFQHDWRQMMRSGGFRPIVFTPHGLAASLWMSITTLAGIGLWRRLGMRHFMGLPMYGLVGLLAVTAILCKSFGALLLLVAGAWALSRPRWRTWLLLLLLSGPIYIAARVFGAAWIDPVLDYVLAQLPEERAGSFWFRVHHEAVLIERAWRQPLFGWSPWYFLIPIDREEGVRELIVSDSLWVISFAAYGLVGLVSQVWVWMQPAFRALYLSRNSSGPDRTPEFTVLAGITTIFMLDCVSNSFPNPIYLMAIGAVVGARRTAPVASAGPVAARTSTVAGWRGHGNVVVLRPRPRPPIDE